MAKILIINLPSSGHVSPTIPLTKELVDRGHEVTYMLSEDFREKIAATGSKFLSYVMISDKDATKYMNSSESKDMKSIVTNIYETALSIGKDYDIIIYEFIFTMGTKLAFALNKPAIQLISTFALNKKIMNFMAFGNDKTDFSETINSSFETTPELNLVFTSREFQIYNEEFDNKRYKFIGPSIPNKISKSDIPFDKLKGKVIYISLGTIFNASLDFFKNCMDAFANMDATKL